MEITLGLYKHYKGNIYRVIGMGKHSETHEPMVIYQAQYNSEQFGDNALWVRPVSLFTDTVQVQGTETPRFTKINT